MQNRTIAIVIGLALLYGCANPVNRVTADKYYAAAVQAQSNRDWAKAREYFARTIVNADLGGADELTLAILWYEYGRSSGVICDWEEATRGLGKAYELDSKYGGPAYMSSYELARMNYDREEYGEAIPYFERTYREFEENQVDTKDPIGYAIFLEEYANSLHALGSEGDTPVLLERARKIREAFPGKEAHTDKTPYGTECPSS